MMSLLLCKLNKVSQTPEGQVAELGGLDLRHSLQSFHPPSQVGQETAICGLKQEWQSKVKLIW